MLPINQGEIEDAISCLSHRGPDDAGTYLNDNRTISLAHRRLSIIDTSSLGHQPMTSDDGRYTIVLNGEIYNYLELSNELKSKGHKLRSQSDTEVLLRLFQILGRDCLSRLRGMFAFSVWDEKEKILFAARDRFGIKPFYYIMDNTSLVFSSELKAIKKIKKNLSVSKNGLYSFLRNGSITPPLTIYENVYALLPGHCLTLDSDGKLDIKKYWEFTDLLYLASDTNNSIFSKSYNFTAQVEIRSALLDSIKAHCVSDVEIGAFLSGGIDSTAVVSLMRQTGYEKIKTISVTFPRNKVDESKYSSVASWKYSTDHFEYRLMEDEVIGDLDRIFYVMDQPTVDGLNTYFVSKAAKSFGLKVVMSGVGGDELFGGYSTFKYIPRIEKFLQMKKFVPFNRLLLDLTAEILKNRIPAKGIEFLKNPFAQKASYRLFRGLFTNDELNKLGFSPIIVTDLNAIDRYSSDLEDKPLNLSALQYASFLETTKYMANQLLRDSDVFSMAHSLELRVPFVDHKLYSAVLPYLEGSYDSTFPKKMLVEGVGDLPDEIVHRPKMGFTFPIAHWMQNGKLKRLVKERLLNNNSILGFNSGAIGKMFRDFERGKMHWSRIWAIYVATNIEK